MGRSDIARKICKYKNAGNNLGVQLGHIRITAVKLAKIATRQRVKRKMTSSGLQNIKNSLFLSNKGKSPSVQHLGVGIVAAIDVNIKSIEIYGPSGKCIKINFIDIIRIEESPSDSFERARWLEAK